MTRGILKITANGLPFLIDREDEEVVGKYRWMTVCNDPDKSKYYLRASDHVGTKLHRLLLNAGPGEEVDHINGIRYDNRRCNLRVVNRRENAKNRRKNITMAGKQPTSQYKGVFWSHGAWEVEIKAGKRYYLGRYKSEIEAAIAYDEASEKYHGQHGVKNFPRGAPNIVRQGRLPRSGYTLTRKGAA
jgi:hypothetical protein